MTMVGIFSAAYNEVFFVRMSKPCAQSQVYAGASPILSTHVPLAPHVDDQDVDVRMAATEALSQMEARKITPAQAVEAAQATGPELHHLLQVTALANAFRRARSAPSRGFDRIRWP